MWVIFLCLGYLIGGLSADNRGDTVDLSYTCVKPETTRNDLSPILLMHGLMANRHVFDGMYEELARQTKRMVCMSDARNHGMSPITEEFNIDLMAEDTIRLLDKLDISKAILLGQSMGGKAAAVTALSYPDRVEKLLVADMRPVTVTPEGISWVKNTIQMVKDSLDAVPEGATNEEAKEAVTSFLLEGFKSLNLDMSRDKLNFFTVCNDGRCQFLLDVDFGLKVIDEPYWQEAPDGFYEGDALFIYGKTSPFKVDEAEDEIRQLFPNAQLFGLEAGHDVYSDKPREFLSEVIRFINGITIKSEL